jgi:hypothetical protein
VANLIAVEVDPQGVALNWIFDHPVAAADNILGLWTNGMNGLNVSTISGDTIRTADGNYSYYYQRGLPAYISPYECNITFSDGAVLNPTPKTLTIEGWPVALNVQTRPRAPLNAPPTYVHTDDITSPDYYLTQDFSQATNFGTHQVANAWLEAHPELLPGILFVHWINP